METDFKLFNPQIDDQKQIPDTPGNYFLVLREGCQLPSIGIAPVYKRKITKIK